MMTSAMTKHAREPLGFEMTSGMAEMMRRVWPIRQMTTQQQTVLNRPRYVSATYAPNKGTT